MKIRLNFPLVEFEGSLHGVVTGLYILLRGYSPWYPAEDDLWWETDEALDEYLKLIERLNQSLPEGYYFGGHKDDPTCLGAWPIENEGNQ